MPATKKKSANLASAKVLADQLVERFTTFCERVEIAGSIRRMEPIVGDIEIVCIPRFGEAMPPGEMFKRECNLAINHIKTNAYYTNSSRAYKIIKGGPRYYQFIYYGMQVDLFMTNKKQWGRMLALRTGPADYSKKIAARWKEMGYKGHNGELVRLRRGIKGDRVKPEFRTEKEFFDFLGWEYVEPEKRG